LKILFTFATSKILKKHHSMFRRIVLFLSLLVCATHVQGNSRVDELRKNMYTAPDSARAAILVNIARQFRDEKVDSCMYYAQKATEKAYSSRQYLALVDAQKLMSQIAIEKKDYVQATRYLRTILDITVRERYWDLAMEGYNAMAQTWLLRNNYAEAVEYLKRGVEIAKDRNNLELQKYFYQALIDSYQKLRNTEAVCEFYPLLMEVNQKIDAEAHSGIVNALQTERETLIAAAEDAKIQWQHRSNISKLFQIIVLIWAVLVSTVLLMAYIWYKSKLTPDIVKTQNDLNMKIYEHEMLLKNQENAFSFLTNHIETNIESLAKNIAQFEAKQGNLPVAADSPLNRILNDIQGLYGFFQNFTLLLQAQSGQLKPQTSTLNIPRLTNNLLADYEKVATVKEIKLLNDVQNNIFAYADEGLVDLVLRNIMSNACKYAPAGAGSVTVGAKVGTRVTTEDGVGEDTNFVEIWVTDDGIGLSPEQAGILFDLTDNLLLPGDPETKGYGLGLAVCKAVIEALKGRIWAETKPDEGFCIRFSLPRAKGTEVKLSLTETADETLSIEEPNEPPPLLLSE